MNKTDIYLASFATFKILYNQKKDIYDVIKEFIKDILYKYQSTSLSVDKIVSYLEDEYDFYIPSAVVKTTLRKLKKEGVVNIKDKIYYLISQEEISKFNNINSCNDEILKKHQEIINDIILYISDKKKDSVKSINSSLVVNNLFDYMTNDNFDTEYGKYINAFILENKSECINSLLQEIKDGIILLNGLKYQIDPGKITTYQLKKDLVLFLDQELLFSAYGYNGEIFKSIFMQDFLPLIKKINSTLQKNKIQLRYLTNTKEDIESFFLAAQNIVCESKIRKPLIENEAMSNIIVGCENRSDVLERKVDFFKFLKKNNILEYDFNYNILDEKISKFNLQNKENTYKLSLVLVKRHKNITTAQIDNYFKIINTINILRQNNHSSPLEDVGYIFITATRALLDLVWDKSIYIENGNVPIATDLDFMIDRFWFKSQNKINNDKKPISFDIALQAKLISKSIFSNKLNYEFNLIKEKIKSGDKSSDQVIDMINEYHIQLENLRGYTFDYQDTFTDELILERRSAYVDNLEQDNQEKNSKIDSLREHNANLIRENEYSKKLINKERKEKIKFKNEIKKKEIAKKRMCRTFISYFKRSIIIAIIFAILFFLFKNSEILIYFFNTYKEHLGNISIIITVFSGIFLLKKLWDCIVKFW